MSCDGADARQASSASTFAWISLSSSMRKQSPDKLAIIDQEQAGGYSVTAKFGRTEMPFGRRRRFRFKGKAPVSYKLALSLFACSVFFEIGARLAIPKWSPVAPDAIHSC